MIILEPEAAALQAAFEALNRYSRVDAAMSPGDVFMVIDAGSGTVDITVHEVRRHDTAGVHMRTVGVPLRSRYTTRTLYTLRMHTNNQACSACAQASEGMIMHAVDV